MTTATAEKDVRPKLKRVWPKHSAAFKNTIVKNHKLRIEVQHEFKATFGVSLEDFWIDNNHGFDSGAFREHVDIERGRHFFTKLRKAYDLDACVLIAKLTGGSLPKEWAKEKKAKTAAAKKKKKTEKSAAKTKKIKAAPLASRVKLATGKRAKKRLQKSK